MNNDKNEERINIVPTADLMPEVKPINNTPENNPVVNNNIPKQEPITQENNVNVNTNNLNNQVSNPVPVDNTTVKTEITNIKKGNGQLVMTEKDNSKVSVSILLIALIIIGAGAYLLIFNGQKKTVICKKNTEYIDSTVTTIFRNQKVSSINYDIIYDLNANQNEELEEYDNSDNTINICNSSEFVNRNEFIIKECNQNNNGETISANIEMTIGEDDRKQSVSNIREYFENEGYTCTVE